MTFFCRGPDTAGVSNIVRRFKTSTTRFKDGKQSQDEVMGSDDHK